MSKGLGASFCFFRPSRPIRFEYLRHTWTNFQNWAQFYFRPRDLPMRLDLMIQSIILNTISTKKCTCESLGPNISTCVIPSKNMSWTLGRNILLKAACFIRSERPTHAFRHHSFNRMAVVGIFNQLKTRFKSESLCPNISTRIVASKSTGRSLGRKI